MYETIWPYEGASQDVEGKPIVDHFIQMFLFVIQMFSLL